jgi:CheY-like chemotaxis protein
MVSAQPTSTTLMLVEGAAPTRHALAQIFSSEGYGIITAANDKEALDRLRTQALPDVILLETGPSSEGRNLLEQLGRDPTLAGVPIVLLAERTVDPAWAMALGAADYIRKPIAIERLLEIVRRLGPD